MNTLAGKYALVTGGATGIGAGIVERLASLDARVACAYNSSQKDAAALAAKLKELGKDILTVKLDVARREEIEPTIRSISEHFGHSIDILVNNAGIAIDPMPVETMSIEVWEKIIAVNLTGAFLCTKYCIPGMKKTGWGRIINMSSVAARTGGGPGCAHYAATKGGLESLTWALARELGPFKITVNAVAPGCIDTRMLRELNGPEVLERVRKMLPLSWLGSPEDVAKAIAFLVSEEASYITGAVIPLNGGMRFD